MADGREVKMKLQEELLALAELVAESLLAISDGLMVESGLSALGKGPEALEDPITNLAIAGLSVESCLQVLQRVGERHQGSRALARVGSTWIAQLAAVQRRQVELLSASMEEGRRERSKAYARSIQEMVARKSILR
jgi:hypothetical protein